MKIATVLKPENGCSLYRCELPIKFLPKSESDEVRFYYQDEIPNPVGIEPISKLEAFNPDIIFFNGLLAGKNIVWILEQKKKGVKIVLDVDDYWELSSTHPLRDYWYKHGYNILYQRTIQIADVVFTTNDFLRNKILPLNKNCVIIPNAVPFGETFFTQDLNVSKLDKMNFLYSGGSTHYKDVLILKNKFDRISTDKFIQDKALFTLAGFNPLNNKHCEWDKMASVFKRTKSYSIVNTLPVQKHMSIYDSADVVLIPLVNSEFNRSKSFLKIIEASTRELPCIVSDTLPYSELKDFPGIFWENWLENIKYCIKNPIFVKEKGKELSEKIKEKYDLSIWSKTRYDIFSHLIKQ